MKNLKEDIPFHITITLLVVGSILLFNIYGPVRGHSLAVNYNWMTAFSDQFLQGDFYPRWLHQSYGGAGSPVFYFYGPMPFWITTLVNRLFCFSCSPSTLVMAGPIFIMGFASVGCYYLIKSFTNQKIAFTAALLYLFLPYHFIVDFWIRSSWGELSSYIFMPLLLLATQKASSGTKNVVLAALCYAGLLYSHLPTALLFSPFLLLYGLLHFGIIKGLYKVAFIVLLGMGLTSVYIIPAMTTQELIYPEFWDIFDPVDWLWFSGKYSTTEAKFVILPILWPIMAILISVVFFSKKEIKQDKLLLTAIASSLCCMILISDLSQPLWQHIGLLAKVQFPWRLGSVFDLFAVIIFAKVLLKLKQRQTLSVSYSLVAFLSIIVMIALYSSRMKERILFKDIETLDQHVSENFEPAEYRTKWLMQLYPGLQSTLGAYPVPNLENPDLERSLQKTPVFSIVKGIGTITEESIQESEFHVKFHATTEVTILMRRFFYPGWHLLNSEDLGIEYRITPSSHYALIEASLPAGDYSLSLVRKPIIEEIIGAIITFLSFLFSIVILFNRKSSLSL